MRDRDKIRINEVIIKVLVAERGLVSHLGSREAVLGPAEGVAVLAQKSVLLFDP